MRPRKLVVFAYTSCHGFESQMCSIQLNPSNTFAKISDRNRPGKVECAKILQVAEGWFCRWFFFSNSVQVCFCSFGYCHFISLISCWGSLRVLCICTLSDLYREVWELILHQSSSTLAKKLQILLFPSDFGLDQLTPVSRFRLKCQLVCRPKKWKFKVINRRVFVKYLNI